ncbi:FecR family protein [Shinella sp. BYT-45]|uniref:FecR family protein n=1 Tax=Shinella sp. BYT-45 TaxID=3377377 RepID=UPI00397FC2A4
MAKTDNEAERKVRDEALAWFVRLHSGDATPAERAAHAAWMAADPGHRAEYGRLGDIWTDLDRIPDPRARPAPQAACRPRPSRRAFLAGGAAALAAGVAAVAVGPPDFLTSDHATGTGERRTVALSDGTTVELDADSAIALDYGATARGVRLVRGRAFFDVAKDARRPFTVHAAEGSATALGTRFVVHEWSGTVTVSVEESAVSVTGPDRRDAVVKAGQYVTYDRQRLSDVASVDVASEVAWRRGKLIFEDRPLRQVLADVNRYRAGTIRVTDGRLLNMRVSGIFDVSDPDGVLEAIRTSLPVRTFELSPWLVILHPV